MKKKMIRIIIVILILLWMRLVFGLSNDNAEKSSSLSFQISNFIVQNEEKAKSIEPVVRKLAHLSEYMARTDFYFMDYF
ncbi:MAG: VanZ family protein [Clostridia bacterium]|nr:VanZ family protein [Clostridia bacterium]